MDLPKQTSSGAHETSGGTDVPPRGRNRVLVVEDDPLLRKLYERILPADRFAVTLAEDGREGLDAVRSEHFDLIVTDCEMPRLDGLSMIRSLRGLGVRTPVVMISGTLRNSALPRDVSDEIAIALPKPVSPVQILAAVSHALPEHADLQIPQGRANRL